MSSLAQMRGGEDDIDTLLRHAHSKPLLTAIDERRLARQIESGDARAKELMIESNLRLVVAIARSYRGCGVPVADLVQEGTIGLVRAVERFDRHRGVKFSTYAVWWIRRSVLDAIASSRMIRVPAKANRQISALRRAESELRRDGPARAPIERLVERTGLSPDAVLSLRATARVAASLDECIGEDATTLGELVVDEHAVDPSDSAIAHEDEREVAALLRLLPRRHREVLIRRYGLEHRQPQGHGEIGRWLGVGEERSRQLEREALHRLRTILQPTSAGVAPGPT